MGPNSSGKKKESLFQKYNSIQDLMPERLEYNTQWKAMSSLKYEDGWVH